MIHGGRTLFFPSKHESDSQGHGSSATGRFADPNLVVNISLLRGLEPQPPPEVAPPHVYQENTTHRYKEGTALKYTKRALPSNVVTRGHPPHVASHAYKRATPS